MWVPLCLGATQGGEEAEFRQQAFLLVLERKKGKSGDYFVRASARANYGPFCEDTVAKVRESYVLEYLILAGYDTSTLH